MRPDAATPPPSTDLQAILIAADFARRKLFDLQLQHRRAVEPAVKAEIATERGHQVGRYLACCNRIVDLTAPDAA